MNLKDEFLGKKIKIIESPMTHQINVEGVVVDETKNSFTILSKGREIKALKNKRVFLIDGTKIFGCDIQKKPEERIKIKEKKNG